MLNINQNFDLKAPVFNFDRDYFNSVEELNAYDTSNVPNHFVTNVAGMLYLFTDGEWLPMLSTMRGTDESYILNLCGAMLYSFKCGNSFCPLLLEMWSRNDSNSSIGNGRIQLRGEMDTNGIEMDATNNTIVLYDEEENGSIRIAAKDHDDNDTNRHIDIIASPTTSTHIDLVDGTLKATIDTGNGFTHKTDDGFVSTLDGYGLNVNNYLYVANGGIGLKGADHKFLIHIGLSRDNNYLYLGSDEETRFKISRPLDNSEGATITGIKSLTAFANPSATKVWATDGSTVDLTTKANKSDVLLKKSASGGYYIEENSNESGVKTFAANSTCTASVAYSFAEGASTKAIGACTHAEGYGTTANGNSAHAEGFNTTALGAYSHAEGEYTSASGSYSHALGTYNVDNKNAIHSVGIGNSTTRKNAEYIYAKNNENSSNLVDDPKNGYKYLIGIGGYDGISTDNSTYKSVQEVIADLTARIEQLERLTANCVSISNVDEQTN